MKMTIKNMIKWRFDFKKTITAVLTVVIICAFIWYFDLHRGDLAVVALVDRRLVLTISFTMVVMFFVEGIFIKVVLSAFKSSVPVFDSFYIALLSRIGNFLLPFRAGIALRASYLKKRYSFPYSKFVSTLYGYYIILFFLYSLLAISALLYKHIVHGITSVPLTLFFFAIFLGMLFLMLVPLKTAWLPEFKSSFLRKVLKVVDDILSGWHRIIADKEILFKLVIVSSCNILLNMLIFYFEFKALGIPVDMANVVLYTSLAGVSLLVSITPGSLGLREAIFLFTSDTLGLGASLIMQMSLLDRSIMFVVLLFFAIPMLTLTFITNNHEKSTD
jgi:uncharacterized membrane protein YbhN (UPF0104 family)